MSDEEDSTASVVDIEMDLLLEAIYRKYGYDFRNYAKAHVKRRLLNRLHLSGMESLSHLQHKVLQEAEFASVLLRDLSINVTEMFRDPLFYKALREVAIPVLKTWSFIKIWHAGCSTGEEVYSTAILLKEEGLYDRVQIYATDFNPFVLQHAKEGIYPSDLMKNYARNFQASGAKSDFSQYYHAKYDSAIMDKQLKQNIVWANHNLVTDGDFAEMHMIVCRNTLIYFNKTLQNKVHGLFNTSLVKGGLLCLGNKETLRFSQYEDRYDVLDRPQRIYKKKYTR